MRAEKVDLVHSHHLGRFVGRVRAFRVHRAAVHVVEVIEAVAGRPIVSGHTACGERIFLLRGLAQSMRQSREEHQHQSSAT